MGRYLQSKLTYITLIVYLYFVMHSGHNQHKDKGIIAQSKSKTTHSLRTGHQSDKITGSTGTVTFIQDGNSIGDIKIVRGAKHPKEITTGKSGGTAGGKIQKKADRDDTDSVVSTGTHNSKKITENKSRKRGVQTNVDMNEVPGSEMEKSSQDPGVEAPGEESGVDEQFIAQLDDEDENYVKRKEKPSKRTRSRAASMQSESGSGTSSLPAPKRKKQRLQRGKSTSVSSNEQVNARLARLERIIRLQALKGLQQHLTDEDDDTAGDDIPPGEKEELSDDDEDEDDEKEDDDGEDDDDDDDDSEDDEEDADDDEDDSLHPPRPPKRAPLTRKGRIARVTLSNHYGDLDSFYPLTFSITRAEREAMVKKAAETENFFPRIKEIERPTTIRSLKDKDRMLYKEVCRLKEMYEIQMAVLFNIVNGKQKRAGKQLLDLLDLTLDTARTANVARLRLRSGNAVIDTIMHAEEESIMQKPYRDILSAKAKDAHDLETVTGGRFFPSGQGSLHKWGKLSGKWNAPSPRAGSRGGRAPRQSRSFSPGGFPPFAATRQSAGRLPFANKQRGFKANQQRRASEPPPSGSGRT
jgi:hypothetical protein